MAKETQKKRDEMENALRIKSTIHLLNLPFPQHKMNSTQNVQ